MTNIQVIGLISILLNATMLWYIFRLLRKFMFISEGLADLFLTTRAFQIFAKSVYGMNSYHGEPIIQEMVLRIQDVTEEIELFREIFEYSLDKELEEELDATEEDAQEESA